MIVNEVAKNVEKIISIDTAKNFFQVLVVNQKTGKKKNTKVRNCEIFLPFFNLLKNITFWCQSTQENVYGTNKQCCSH